MARKNKKRMNKEISGYQITVLHSRKGYRAGFNNSVGKTDYSTVSTVSETCISSYILTILASCDEYLRLLSLICAILSNMLSEQRVCYLHDVLL